MKISAAGTSTTTKVQIIHYYCEVWILNYQNMSALPCFVLYLVCTAFSISGRSLISLLSGSFCVVGNKVQPSWEGMSCGVPSNLLTHARAGPDTPPKAKRCLDCCFCFTLQL